MLPGEFMEYRSTYSVLFCLLCVLASGCAGSREDGVGEGGPETTDEKAVTGSPDNEGVSGDQPPPHSDEQAILGSWRSTRFEMKGQVVPDGAGGKAVFLKDKLWLHGLPMSYTLDPQQDPKHLDLDGRLAAIYRLEGNSLTICFATGSPDPRPKDFTTAEGDGRQLIFFERLAPLSPDAPDVEYDPELKAAILQAVALLESDRVEEFLTRLMAPQLRASLVGDKWEEAVEHVTGQREEFLATFRVLPKLMPKMNLADADAVFDLTTIHIEGGLPFQEVKFEQIAGNWYLQPGQ